MNSAEETLIHYCSMSLDRCVEQRKDPEWIHRQLNKTDTRVIAFRRNRVLLEEIESSQTAYKFSYIAATSIRESVGMDQLVYLGEQSEIHLFAFDIDSVNKSLFSIIVDESQFADLRYVSTSMQLDQASIAAYARGLLHWHRYHKYCGRCSHITNSVHGGHMRQCLNPDCCKQHFPRTDPAVIVLVESYRETDNTPVCLLGRHKRLPARMYSTLAGYVEPGENLEAAIKREILEEAGIHLREITYFASQPWPFPSALMMGFFAISDELELNIDTNELENASWFSRDQLRSFGEYNDEHAAYNLPRKDSIARNLIDSWINLETAVDC